MHAWVCVALGIALVCLQACGDSNKPSQDIVPPHTRIEPAGGLYAAWPSEITLSSEDGATIHYRWGEGAEQQYTKPIAPPTDGGLHQRLTVWAKDEAGNREPVRREHYVRRPSAPDLDLVNLNQSVIGSNESTTLRWRSTAIGATYELAVTSGDWGPGKRLAQGKVTTEAEQQVTFNGSDLVAGHNRLWLRVTAPDGAVAATSRWLTAYTRPARTQSSPPGGVFGTAQTVSLSTERPAAIYYTTDGTAPTEDSTAYTEPCSIADTATVRFFSVDPYGNYESAQEVTIAIEPQAATLALLAPVPIAIGTANPFVFAWKSDQEGQYEVVLNHRDGTWKRTILQGTAKKNEAVNTTIARNFLSPGEWRIQVRVRPAAGQPGELILPIRVYYREPFADTRYLNSEPTTATWDTNRQHVSLSRGPRLLSTYNTRGRGRRVTVKGEYAYLASSKGGLHIVDTSEPDQPRRVGRFYPHGKAVALATYQSYVYMAASGSGLTIFDVTDPTVPRLVGTQPVRGSASDITIVAPYAYVGTKSGHLVVFDLAAPRQPKRLGQIDTGGRVVDIAVHNGIAYVACLDQGLVILDVHDPQHPRLLRQWPTRNAATGVAVHDHYVLVAAGELEVLDITQPEAPTRVMTHYLRSAYGVTVKPPYAIVASGTDGVQIVNITEKSPVISSPSSHYASRLTLTDNQALVADTRGGLQLLDVSNPERPQIRLKLEEFGTIVDVAVNGEIAYLANDQASNSLVVVDFSHPDELRIIGWYHSEMTTDVAVWEEWALLSDAAGLLHLLTINPPSRPRLRDTLALTGRLQRLLVQPPYAFVASDDAGLHVVELAPDGQLMHRSTLTLPGRALDLALKDNTLYIAAGEGGIQVVDVKTPAQPVVISTYQHSDGKGDHLIRLSLSSDYLFAIDNQRGVQIFNQVPGAPLALKQHFDVPKGAPWGLTSVGPYVFVTTLLHSLYAYELTPSSDLKLLSTSPFGGSAVTAVDDHLYIAVRGSRGVPGGLRLVETFAVVADEAAQMLTTQGISLLPLTQPGAQRVHRAYTFHTPSGVESTVISIPEAPVRTARLQVQDFWGPHGRIDYALSNDGGAHWHPVQPGSWFSFPATGADVRWRATLTTSDVLQTPLIESIQIDVASEGAVRP